MAEEDPIFPLRVYMVARDGTYVEPIEIVSEAQLYGPGMRWLVRDAKARGAEIIITDPGDLTLFHMRGGVILFPIGCEPAAKVLNGDD